MSGPKAPLEDLGTRMSTIVLHDLDVAEERAAALTTTEAAIVGGWLAELPDVLSMPALDGAR